MISTWRKHTAILLVGLAVLASAWFEVLSHMASILWNFDVFAHGLLAPVVCMALIWARRMHLLKMTPRFSVWGVAGLFASCLLWLLAGLLDVALFAHVAFVSGVQALVLAAFGWRIYRALTFPMLFLYFSVPFGYELVGPLQRMTAGMVIWVLDLINADFSAEGMLITLPSGLYEVAEACAGVKFFFTSIFTGVLLSHLVFRSWNRRAAIIAFSIVLPIIANALRVLLILLIAEVSDQRLAKGFDHLVYGWVFLSVVLLMLVTTAYRYSDKSLTDRTISFDTAQASVAAQQPTLTILVLLGALLPWATTWILPPNQIGETRLKTTVSHPMVLDDAAGFRVLADAGHVARPEFLLADKSRASLLRKNGSVFHAYVAEIEILSSAQRLFHPGNTLVDHTWRQIELTNSVRQVGVCQLAISERIFRRGEERSIVWASYAVDDVTVKNDIEEKFQTALQLLKGEHASGKVWVLSAPLVGEPDLIRQIFLEFLSTFPVDGYLRGAGGALKRDNSICAE